MSIELSNVEADKLFHCAITAGELGLANMLLEKGSNIHQSFSIQIGSIGQIVNVVTYLHYYQKRNIHFKPLISALIAAGASCDGVEFLQDSGYGTHPVVANYSPLSAIFYNQQVLADKLSAIRVLIEAGANPLQKLSDGNNLIHVLAINSKHKENQELMEHLLTNVLGEHSESLLKEVNHDGETPLVTYLKYATSISYIRGTVQGVVEMMVQQGARYILSAKDLPDCTFLDAEVSIPDYCKRKGCEISMELLAEDIARNNSKPSTKSPRIM